MKQILALILISVPALGATRYIAPDGTDSGSALTEATAWLTPDYAIGNTAATTDGDTLIFCAGIDGEPGTGTWDGTGGADPPSGPIMYKGGTAGDWLTFLADTSCTIIFDGSGLATPPNRAFFAQIQGTRFPTYLHFKGLWFRDYFDDDETDSGSPTGTIWIGNQLSASTQGGLIVEDCRFYASSPGAGAYVDGGVVAFGGAAGYDIDTLIVRNCSFENNSNASIRQSGTDATVHYIEIRDNLIHRDPALWRCPDPDGPNGINILDYDVHEVLIEGNEISGWDHGMEVRGEPPAGREWWMPNPGCVIRGNYIHDLTDDFIYLHGEDGSGEPWSTRHWLVENNVCYYGGDEGFEVQGDRHLIQHNTIQRNGNWLLAFSNPGGSGGLHPSKRHVVRNNIFSDAAGDERSHCEGDGDDGVFVNLDNAVTLDLELYGNVFFDRDGALQVSDQNDGAVTTVAGLNGTWASGTGIGNVEADPVLADTASVSGPPFWSGVNLHPRSNSPAVNSGTSTGRTAGALPCGECFHWALNTTAADSVHLETFDRAMASTGVYYHSGLWHYNGSHVHDADLDSTAAGYPKAKWSIYRAGLSTPEVEWQSTPVMTQIDSVRAVGTTWLADSVRVDLQVAATEGSIEFKDSGSGLRIGNVHYQVTDGLSGPIVQKTISASGLETFWYTINTNYFIDAWVPGAYSLFTDNWKPISAGVDKVFSLDPLPTSPPASAAEVSMAFYTGDFQAGLIDSMEVFVRPLGRRPRAGVVFIPEEWVSLGLTDTNGRIEFSIFKSSELAASGSKANRLNWQLRAIDKRSPKLHPDIHVPEFTTPDSTNANVVWNIP